MGAMSRGTWLCVSALYLGTLAGALSAIGDVVFAKGPRNDTVSVGSKHSLSCEAQVPGIHWRVRWLRDGTLLATDHETDRIVSRDAFLRKWDDSSYTFSSTLSFSRVQHADAGNYSCRLDTDGEAVAFSEGGHLRVEVGEPFKLSCDAAGPPDPINITWYRNGHIRVNLADNHPPDTLLVPGIQEAASYTCHASNLKGTSVSKEAKINIKALPSKPLELKAVILDRHKLLQLSWRPGFDGYSLLTLCHVQHTQVFRGSGDFADFPSPEPALGGEIATTFDTTVDSSQFDVLEVKVPPFVAAMRNLKASADYALRVACSNEVGFSPWSSWLRANTSLNDSVKVKQRDENLAAFVCLAILVGLAVVVLLVVFLWKKRKDAETRVSFVSEPLIAVQTFSRQSPKLMLQTLGVPEALWEKLTDVVLNRESLSMGKVLGEGEFGIVFEGTLKKADVELQVAVKTMKVDICPRYEIESFLNEVLRMKDFDHPNVISLLGISLDAPSGSSFPRPMAVMPFMKHGDLHSFLLQSRLEYMPMYIPLQSLLRFVLDIARGMEYLSGRNFVHRDLAARNCMLHEDLTVCVADFGLAKKIYSGDYYRQGQVTRMPVKWLALECMTDHLYTAKSDVWAFGVTMWEIVMRGQVPYPGVENYQMYEYLMMGKRLVQPPDCLDELYTIMSSCWTIDPGDRPDFSNIVHQLEVVLSSLPSLGADAIPIYTNEMPGADASSTIGASEEASGLGDPTAEPGCTDSCDSDSTIAEVHCSQNDYAYTDNVSGPLDT
uniref:tyrosine-protein kinase receptor UFO-like isoform X2 n=1 Tax=Myxine glutinosa TaxID=7769 RepID=UPI00358FEB3B